MFKSNLNANGKASQESKPCISPLNDYINMTATGEEDYERRHIKFLSMMNEAEGVGPVDYEKMKESTVSLFVRNYPDKLKATNNKNLLIGLKEKEKNRVLKSKLFNSKCREKTEFCGEKELQKLMRIDVKKSLEKNLKLIKKERKELTRYKTSLI